MTTRSTAPQRSCSATTLLWLALPGVLFFGACGDDLAAQLDGALPSCTSDDDCAPGSICEASRCIPPRDAGSDAPAPPALDVTPTLLDFGSPSVGVETTLELTLRNVGGSALHVTRLELSEVDARAEFSALPLGDVALELPVLGTSVVLVTLRPTDDEADLGQLRIHSDDPAAPITEVALLSEVKGAPALEVVPVSVDFGTLVWGASATVDLDVRNVGTGNAPLAFTGVSITDESRRSFAYSTELFAIAPATLDETPAAVPLLLAPGGLAARVRLTVNTTGLGAGPLPVEDLVFTTDSVVPADAERRVPLEGLVLGCALPAPETCNGTDEDCDLEVDEGNPGGGVACDSGAPGACAPGLTACITGVLACRPDAVPTTESCDGVDNDCDGAIDDALVRGCSTPCGAGIEVCSSGAWGGCSVLAPTLELCDGADNDCNATTLDGSADPLVGAACDGVDSDLCAESSWTCAAGTLICPDTSTNTLDLCNSIDDDCDPTSVDGAEEVGLGSSCDGGGDGDSCRDGALACLAGTLACADTDDVPLLCSTLLEAGYSHACAMDSLAELRCWGSNSNGQLGDGTTIARSTPVRVLTTATVTQLSLGQLHTCAVIAGDTVECWGDNFWGQLGDGSTSDRTMPVAVVGLTGVLEVAAGHGHTCALLADSTVTCWGLNFFGQLGDGTNDSRATPVTVPGLTAVVVLDAGDDYTCAVRIDGTARCWGINTFGQLGDGSRFHRSTPVTVVGLAGAVEVALGTEHACARLGSGGVSCWGRNRYGQLGDGSTSDHATSAAVTGLSGAVELDSGEYHSCARLADSALRCWGENSQGQLGDGTTTDRHSPTTVWSVSSATRAATGARHSCTRLAGGTVRCWGVNSGGELGDGTTLSPRITPVTTLLP